MPIGNNDANNGIENAKCHKNLAPKMPSAKIYWHL